MIAKVRFNNKMLGNIEGETIKELIEENFDLFKSVISDEAGNAAGFLLNKAWIVRINDDVCEFHVIAHGSDNLIAYDPTKDVQKEIVFNVHGIPVDEFNGIYEFEIKQNEEFNPFDDKHFDNKSAVVGILEGCLDSVAYMNGIYSSSKVPSKSVSMSFPNLKNRNLPVYVSQLMARFSLLKNVKIREKECYNLIEKANNALAVLMEKDNTQIDGMELFYYHKTMHYFDRLNKITALKYYRKLSGKTQTEIAESIGMSLRQYQRYESKNSSLGDANKIIVNKIAELINVKPEQLVNGGLVKFVSINKRSKDEE